MVLGGYTSDFLPRARGTRDERFGGVPLLIGEDEGLFDNFLSIRESLRNGSLVMVGHDTQE